ncbi:MAG: hypothetical protein GY810_24230 [Aureispira sp.]|nr:hypothetical protein [Aureispira sp.]
MLQITSLTISTRTQRLLANKQDQINILANYTQEVQKASTLWDGKSSTSIYFSEIKAKLKKMAVAHHTCNYCENETGSHVEHIFPKSLYPDKTFVWDNYLWACSICNSDYKGSKFKTFNAPNTPQHTDITPLNPRNYNRPNNDALLINPRSENPMHFLWLDLKTGVFVERQNQRTRDWWRANYTIELLALNNREELVKGRKKAYNEYWNMLNRYINVLNATNFNELDAAYSQATPVPRNKAFNFIQTQCCLNIQEAILTYPHPTVWEEMKRQHLHYPKLANLFTQIPTALTWSI